MDSSKRNDGIRKLSFGENGNGYPLEERVSLDASGDVLGNSEFVTTTGSTVSQQAANTLAPADGDQPFTALGERQDFDFDVSGEGDFSALDALIVIQEIVLNGQRTLEEGIDDAIRRLDINGDGDLTVLDALLVINDLVLQGQGKAVAPDAQGAADAAAAISLAGGDSARIEFENNDAITLGDTLGLTLEGLGITQNFVGGNAALSLAQELGIALPENVVERPGTQTKPDDLRAIILSVNTYQQEQGFLSRSVAFGSIASVYPVDDIPFEGSSGALISGQDYLSILSQASSRSTADLLSRAALSDAFSLPLPIRDVDAASLLAASLPEGALRQGTILAEIGALYSVDAIDITDPSLVSKVGEFVRILSQASGVPETDILAAVSEDPLAITTRDMLNAGLAFVVPEGSIPRADLFAVLNDLQARFPDEVDTGAVNFNGGLDRFFLFSEAADAFAAAIPSLSEEFRVRKNAAGEFNIVQDEELGALIEASETGLGSPQVVPPQDTSGDAPDPSEVDVITVEAIQEDLGDEITVAEATQYVLNTVPEANDDALNTILSFGPAFTGRILDLGTFAYVADQAFEIPRNPDGQTSGQQSNNSGYGDLESQGVIDLSADPTEVVTPESFHTIIHAVLDVEGIDPPVIVTQDPDETVDPEAFQPIIAIAPAAGENLSGPEILTQLNRINDPNFDTGSINSVFINDIDDITISVLNTMLEQGGITNADILFAEPDSAVLVSNETLDDVITAIAEDRHLQS